MLDTVVDAGSIQECLGRNASPVRAFATECISLNQSHASAGFGCNVGGDATTSAGADDDQVKVVFYSCHICPPVPLISLYAEFGRRRRLLDCHAAELRRFCGEYQPK